MKLFWSSRSPFARKARKQGIDGAFGELKAVVVVEVLNELVAVRFTKTVDRRQHAELGETLAKLGAPLLEIE